MPSPDIFQRIKQTLKRGGPGVIGAIVGFFLALIWVRFGFFRLVFILILTALGYYIGVRYFSDRETVRRWLDKIFPPGKFR
ncbi:MAG: DUF2273 domain-containing protein [Saccharofermentanales bacterium]|jgi:uncharacterized membrane protein|nr:DUF2273 domain-containing protein [Eubacteriales bacterium]MDD3611281.1 DUF2273 domain-containing protein [Eubacteriales bacterium]HHU04628.1 DUF2273 domain-containing protein [Fastidiosipila sp.]